MTIRRAIAGVFLIPLFIVKSLLARRANDQGEWDLVVRHLALLHGWRMRTDSTSFMSACARCHLGDWQGACDDFEAIRGAMLDDAECEHQRRFNYALALGQLGRTSEALRELARHSFEGWSDQDRAKVDSLHQRLLFDERQKANPH